MKKITFLVALIATFTMNAQYTEGFDDITTLVGDGWTFINVSDDAANAANPDYFQGADANFPSFEGVDSYMSVNFNSTAGTVIDNWAILPTMTLIDGDTFTFYTRTATGSNFPDALEVRVSLDGDDSVLPTSTDPGSFTTLGLQINPDLTTGGYPEDWELQTVTIEGAATATDIRIAFRYFISNDAGPTGNNSNLIGIDSAAIQTTLSADEFTANGFSQFYNVESSELRLNASVPMQAVKVFNTLGQEVVNRSLSNTEVSVNLSNLSNGIYITQVVIGNTTETFKVIKR